MESHTIGDHCSWGRGVLCANNTSVQSLYWGGLGLSGSLPSSINKLKSLIYIDISRNNISGTIPDLDLPSLEGMYASQNWLSGGFPTGNFPELWRLFIDHNRLSGSLPQGLD